MIIAENHPAVRNGIWMLIDAQPEMTMAAEAADGKSVVNLLNAGMPAGIVISDINMPVMDVHAFFKHIRKSGHSVRTVVLSIPDTE